MNWKDFVRRLQAAMNAAGASPRLTEDGDPGPKTQAALEGFDVDITVKRRVAAPVTGARPVNPAYQEAKKYEGKTETNSAFGAWLSKFWPKAGLPNYKTIVGSSFAWCALFLVAMNSETGQKYVASAAARSWAKYGVEVNWKQDGIPRGAVIHLNHAGNCSSGSSNHVTFADGDCTVAELTKPGATFPGFGGNQGNTVKRSAYGVREICAVRWPSEIPKPGPVTKSYNCSVKATGEESTR